ncbi:MAG TPA: MerR family transcriptional regulator [Spirochaetia bacterium]|nr:MerR family transcriptional regulator [Spirochaetia bacterium]
MYTISQIGNLFRLSRSTLLYYDTIGLLSPSLRSPAGYRLYSEKDREKLNQIRLFRGLGIPVSGVRLFFERKSETLTPFLLKRLLAINSQIDELRDQQRAILGMIETEGLLLGSKPFGQKHRELGKEVGLGEDNYRIVHRIFQRTSPAEHRRFLRHLGFTGPEIRAFVKKNA